MALKPTDAVRDSNTVLFGSNRADELDIPNGLIFWEVRSITVTFGFRNAPTSASVNQGMLQSSGNQYSGFCLLGV